jgi:hypothetical protein
MKIYLWLSEKQENIERYLFSLGLGKNLLSFFYLMPAFQPKIIWIWFMLSYLLEREIEKYWHPIDVSFDEGINELGSIRTVEMTISNTTYHKVPTPTGLCKELLDAADVKLPLMIPMKDRS